jgi:hypothetical protein
MRAVDLLNLPNGISVILKILFFPLKLLFRIFKIAYRQILIVPYRLKIFNIFRIPVVINNYNRLTHPLQLIAFLENCGFTNIIILDNKSSYPPLLSYYNSCQHQVIKSAVNYGHLALWESGLYHKLKWNYFVYTDSDLVPINECPKNFIEFFRARLEAKVSLDKVGFGIKIDDLPDHFPLKSRVVDYEKKYWQKEVETNIYDAPIDTTFALYKPLSNLIQGHASTQKANRVGFPYLVRHMPWYVDSKNLTEEEKQFIVSSNTSSSIAEHFKGRKNIY